MHVNATIRSGAITPASRAVIRYHFASKSDAEGEGGADPSRRLQPAGREDLPYRVELWDEPKISVEQVLAVTANASIGYAAYYAATREYSDRFVTLRHKSRVISKWNAPTDGR